MHIQYSRTTSINVCIADTEYSMLSSLLNFVYLLSSGYRYLLPKEMDFLLLSEVATDADQFNNCALFIHLALAFRSQLDELVPQLGVEYDLVSTFTAPP